MLTLTVLIADDDPVTLRLLTATLQHAGYRILTAMDAMQAVMVAHRNVPDAIVLDVLMPGGSGLQVLERLKASTETQRIPVVAISSSPDATLPARSLALGAEAFLPKPVDPAELGRLLKTLMDQAPSPPAGPAAG